MLSIIPTAAEARKQVNEMQSSLGQKMQAEVAEAIKLAIDNMETQCSIEDTLPEALVEVLKDMGYKVQNCTHYNDFGTIISW